MRRRRKPSKRRLSRFQAGALGIIVIALVTYGCYTKFASPVSSSYTIHVDFASANGLVQNAPVRIAGVDVGKVTGVSTVAGPGGRGKQEADVSMQIQGNGLPIHRDATFWIRPRIFLEGNFFVDLYPGTPESPDVRNGHTFPTAAGREPVQFDQLLSSLQLNTRQNLQTLIDEYGKAVKIGGPDYNASIKYWLPAYKYTSVVSHDFLGQHPGDLQNYIASAGTTAAALNAHPLTLENLITYFNTTANAFARESRNLQATVANLPKTLAASRPAFTALNDAFPSIDRFAQAFVPGVRSSGPTIDASLPFITQLNDLVQPAELRGLVSDLKPTIPALARLTQATIPLMKNEVRPLSSCVANVIYPWSQLSIDDGTLNDSTGFPVRKVFQEGVDYLPGLAGESRDFDANGPYIRVLGTGGTATYSLSPGLFGTSLSSTMRVQPQLPPNGTRPPLHPNTPCETQTPLTDSTLYAPPGGPISQTQTSSSAAEKARWASAVTAAIGAIKTVSNREGVNVKLSSALTKDLKLP